MIRRYKPLQRSRKRICRVSKVRRTRLTEYYEKRLEFLRANLWCQVGSCKNSSTQVHHLAGRHGKRLLDFERCVATCFTCHRKIHDHPAWAKANGYLL